MTNISGAQERKINPEDPWHGFRDSVIQFQPDAEGVSQLALEFSKLGNELDFEMQKWARPYDSSRRVLVETFSGNVYFVQGDRVINMNQSAELGRLVAGSAKNLEPVTIGERWRAAGYHTSSVTRALIKHKVVSNGAAGEIVDNEDPFVKAERLVSEIESVSDLQKARKQRVAGLLGKLTREK